MEREVHSEKQDGVVDVVKSYGWIKVDEDVEAFGVWSLRRGGDC